MGRVACPHCRGEIDDLVLRCPICGERTKEGQAFLKDRADKQRAKSFKQFIVLLMVLVAGYVVWNMLGVFLGGSAAMAPPASSTSPAP